MLSTADADIKYMLMRKNEVVTKDALYGDKGNV